MEGLAHEAENFRGCFGERHAEPAKFEVGDGGAKPVASLSFPRVELHPYSPEHRRTIPLEERSGSREVGDGTTARGTNLWVSQGASSAQKVLAERLVASRSAWGGIPDEAIQKHGGVEGVIPDIGDDKSKFNDPTGDNVASNREPVGGTADGAVTST